MPKPIRPANASKHPERREGGGVATTCVTPPRVLSSSGESQTPALDVPRIRNTVLVDSEGQRPTESSRNESKRLSATDISALASMKNVAKCDTWCELQNPVNHRVFERKLRPKPLGRGHACLGVTHRHPHAKAHRGERWPPATHPSWLVENQGNVGVPPARNGG